MRFLIVNSDYPPFLADLYGREPGLEERSYDEQRRVRMESLFGVAGFYSYNLRKLGHRPTERHPARRRSDVRRRLRRQPRDRHGGARAVGVPRDGLRVHRHPERAP